MSNTNSAYVEIPQQCISTSANAQPATLSEASKCQYLVQRSPLLSHIDSHAMPSAYINFLFSCPTLCQPVLTGDLADKY